MRGVATILGATVRTVVWRGIRLTSFKETSEKPDGPGVHGYLDKYKEFWVELSAYLTAAGLLRVAYLPTLSLLCGAPSL